VECLVLWWYF